GSESLDGAEYWLGTDGQGRDMYSGILYGLRISLLGGVGFAALALAFGTTLGLVAGYAGGRVDNFLLRRGGLQLGFPTLMVALIILAVLGTGIMNVVIAIMIVEWAYYARTVRATALLERQKEYVQAAECLVLPKRRILFAHILPNCLPPLVVIAA